MKKILIILAFGVLYLSFYKTASAAIITKNNSTIILNVLGAQDTDGLQTIANSITNIISNININFDDKKLVLSYKNESTNQEIDLSNFSGEVVEIIKEHESDSLIVLTDKDSFSLQQRGILVKTTYPILISDNLQDLTLVTNSGNRYLNILPYDAVTPLIRTKLIDEINNNGEVALIELDAGELAYYIQAEKTHRLFDLVSLKADVDVSVSALSGDVLSINQPVWSRVLSFLKV